ncbi:MAG: gliding motility protein GldN [Bacteroidales bacterium]|nr:gliding motility protein GldN [Bacteroidales bacterium]
MITTKQITATLIFIMITLCSHDLMAQFVEPQPNDYYQRTMTWEQKPQELGYVREADVYWGKLIWRTIDVREKENQYFYFPNTPEGIRGRKNLAYVLWDAIVAGEIEIFEDDEMKIPLDGQVVVERATRSDTVEMAVYDDWGEADYTTVFVPHEFSSEDIYQYSVKEAVYLDRARSGMQVRKLGLAPMEEKYKYIDGEAEFMGTQTLFWIPMQSWNVRVLFAKKEAYCRENLVHLPTWEYAFNSFMYTSFITREDNVYNRAIHEYLTGEDALIESERIEEEIMNISLDMWEY